METSLQVPAPFCLLCCHGSHPRIVSLFFSLSVPPSCSWLTTRSGNHNSVCLSFPFFPLHSSLYQRNSSPFWIIAVCLLRVCVREHALRGIPNRLPMMGYYGDGKYQAGWPVCCKIVYLEHCTPSLADRDFFGVVISPWTHSALSGYFGSTLFWDVPACGLLTCAAPGCRRAQNHMYGNTLHTT